MDNFSSPYDQIREPYRQLVSQKHPNWVHGWPILSGANSKSWNLPNGWAAIHLEHTGNPTMQSISGLGDLPSGILHNIPLVEENVDKIRDIIRKYTHATRNDAILILRPDSYLPNSELHLLLHKHEVAMGLAPMKLFLSHKGTDKSIVREYKQTLQSFGFDPWIDEDAMAAGASLDRSIMQGMKESCAVVFFITNNFSDESWLANEIEYARIEQRSRPKEFSIVTLVFEENGRKPSVPDLLKSFVWKEPRGDLEALREIVRAVPIRVGDIRFK